MNDKELVNHLLIDRFIVINDYIGNSQPIGYIFSCTPALKSYYERFTANFRKLEWWEERKSTELPFYLKTKAGNSVRKILWINNDIVCFDNGVQKKIKDWYPATEEEYIKHSEKVVEHKTIKKHQNSLKNDNTLLVLVVMYVITICLILFFTLI